MLTASMSPTENRVPSMEFMPSQVGEELRTLLEGALAVV